MGEESENDKEGGGEGGEGRNARSFPSSARFLSLLDGFSLDRFFGADLDDTETDARTITRSRDEKKKATVTLRRQRPENA